MIAIGGAIGTGLFLGSALAVRIAGPGVIVSYLVGAVIALLFMGALSEMAVAHPTAGSFGVYAEMYLNAWAGFTMRYTYWAAQCIAIGGEATAVAIYCRWWFPGTPAWLWILGFAIALVAINARTVRTFGRFEYWFAMVKVVAIVLFIVLGLGLLLGAGPAPAIGFENFTAHGGFLPTGWTGVWAAMVFVIFSFMGTEVVAVTAGEAKDPETAVPRAMRRTVGRLILFYIGAITVLVAIVPWTTIQPGSSITASPFVSVFRAVGIPAAAHVVNLVVITAAASSMNCNLYMASRMLFSLARGGYAPAALGRVSGRGAPLPALFASAGGLAVALIIAVIYPESAFQYLFGIALFGGLFVLVHDLPDASRFSSPLDRCQWFATSRTAHRFSLHVDCGSARDSRDPDHDVVGCRHAHRTCVGCAVALRAFGRVLLRLPAPGAGPGLRACRAVPDRANGVTRMATTSR